jgi:hypothetical protein
MAAFEGPHRASRLWFLRSLAFAPLSGVLLSIAVNHGHPWTFGLLALVPLLMIFGAFVSLTLDVEAWRRREVSARVAVVLVGSNVLFILPRSLTLPATGAFWQPSVLLRLLICVTPYPLVAWLARPHPAGRATTRAAWAAWAGLALIATSWPALLVGTQDFAAQQVRREIGVPSAMFLTIDNPPRDPATGYIRSGDALWTPYDSAGGPGAGGLDYDPDDLDMLVFPADEPTPCAVVGPLIQQAIGIEFPESDRCTHPSANLWSIPGAPEEGAVTDIERYQGYYISLSVDGASNDPLPASALPGLLATVHPASDAQIARTGKFSFWGWLD